MKTSTSHLSFLVDDQHFLDDLQKLPWQYAIDEWCQHGVKHLNIKRGLGRHPVVFVKVENKNFVVKQIGFEVAQREIDNYKESPLAAFWNRLARKMRKVVKSL